MSYLLIQFARLIANTSVILRKLFQFILFYHFLNRNWDQFPPHNNLYFLQHIDILPTGGTWIFPPGCSLCVKRFLVVFQLCIRCQVSEGVKKLMELSDKEGGCLVRINFKNNFLVPQDSLNLFSTFPTNVSWYLNRSSELASVLIKTALIWFVSWVLSPGQWDCTKQSNTVHVFTLCYSS